jgi:hypothetical protein
MGQDGTIYDGTVFYYILGWKFSIQFNPAIGYFRLVPPVP